MARKWDAAPCPLCAVGTLHDGRKLVEQVYKGQVFRSEVQGAFCDHCQEGVLEWAWTNQTHGGGGEPVPLARSPPRITGRTEATLT